ncbi:alpha/beta fold hydrolase [Conexibacter woesei]|uniref:alpha/beta fold hydrolase n=1 Tax=Conexibacter woesei TaxID=191495 RepID=UPI0003F4F6E7|nr:alpha/beta hydrolase [Conexibacter woesei]
MSDRETLVLFHGLTMSGRAWHATRPFLAGDFDVVTPTALGHAGGRSPQHRPIKIADVVDDAERTLDELQIDRAHLAGNSMGGWVALELARRGRAATVTALSPAGTWDPTSREHKRTRNALARAGTDSRRSRALLPLVLHVPQIRRFAMRGTSADGARLTPREIIAAADDLLGCTVLDDLLTTTESLPPLHIDPATTPITVAWSGADALLLPDVNGALAKQLIPAANHIILPGVGHVPMLDDPALVAATIRATIAQERRPVRTLTA